MAAVKYGVRLLKCVLGSSVEAYLNPLVGSITSFPQLVYFPHEVDSILTFISSNVLFTF